MIVIRMPSSQCSPEKARDPVLQLCLVQIHRQPMRSMIKQKAQLASAALGAQNVKMTWLERGAKYDERGAK
jgi:hypothetical protein